MVYQPAYADRRRFFRLRYPEPVRPEILLNGARWPVEEISAQGIVFLSDDMSFRLRQPFYAFVRFHDGEVVSVEGNILRMKRDKVIAACLIKGFTPERIELERTRIAQAEAAASAPGSVEE